MNTINKKLHKFFKENLSEFISAINELDSYNSYLGDNRLCEMEMLDEFYQGKNATEILRRAFYGHDESNGEKSEFNPNREYFYFNAYGNLVSVAEYEKKDYYKGFLDEYAIEQIIENAENLNLSDAVMAIINGGGE